MATTANTIVTEMQRAQARRSAIAENSARPARVRMTYVTVGPGEVALTTPMMFGTTFLEEPSVACGHILSDQPVPGDYPQVTTGVWCGPSQPGRTDVWARDNRGYIIGFYPYMVISASRAYRIQHHWTFEGTALKNIPYPTN